ncbi:HTH-type transcriptional regulator SgrR [Rouxiella badensis]|jgi:SgrR family transcriptional regulator|uniref:Transcriptional regulator SgrR n=1 Tax=Rouxiella badensis TaxID=1646377 RepID=A0A1X0WKA7_9GAMM|nr:HTH-type transcriptional regulator SgrR [Rouxiella badensis]MCC3702633.1 HTH-type transcriptional regulator SgrR [Rouxiella badensis]MCC3718816.1 HTH-type transcriptional regulator SgrR [Rouxiella badensis]MCC3727845.1 HTH-type transcriptional regulator SgrR [Rouxiella badensis]MCC3732987.1 HTH-type transcriptional regulator SgrR [Rouxiella badensis]MCC3739589.1 HTH-type transcriptional regulator SgrR [Rouxiella badensis]
MSSPRLQQQFLRLWQHCQGQSAETTLQSLSEAINCSRRHMRSLLGSMQNEGWINWEAESGRGKKSRLTFHLTGLALQQLRAEELIEQDRVDQVVQLVGDKTLVRQMLLSQLGRRFRQGKHILRVLYYRSLPNLLPGSMLRRSETHLARQIFSGLIGINEENGELRGDIAHHWQSVTPLHWRFYLRPAIHFHHGRELEMTDIITTFARLKHHPLFTHFSRVESPTPNVIDIHLRQPDHWLPWLLGSVHALILPQEWASLPDFARHPIGTGPYAVVHNQQTQLRIRAFDEYFGYRALLDEVNIWVLPELTEELVHSGVQLQADDTANDQLESRLEEGCYFVLFDQRSPAGSNTMLREWLCEVINPIALLNASAPAYQRYWSPAYGLLPRWHHRRPQLQQPKPIDIKELTLTFYSDHSEYQDICQALAPLLAAHDVKLNVQIVDYATWHRGEAKSDLWLGSANFTLPIEFSLFATLFELPLMQFCLGDRLENAAQKWRAGELPLAEWTQKLVNGGHIHPLFHHWLLLQGQRSMRGVRMNTLGWFDFKSAWFAPPDA